MQSRLAPAVLSLFLSLSLLLSMAASAQVSVSINIAPPPLLTYAQPPVPGEGYIWIPGYWSWSDPDSGYYWVPGTWVLAPNEGDLWTPGYWAFESTSYFWHIGYWGRRVGFYGGINYGHGYYGSGYQGGRWDHGAFRYNRAISNVNAQVGRYAYSAPAAAHGAGSRTSFNGGKSGTAAHPSAREREFQTTEHAGPRPEQRDHETSARGMPTQRATGPHGVPQVAATPRPSEFAAPNVEHVRPGPHVGAGRDGAVSGQATPGLRPPAEQQRFEQQRPEQPRSEPQPSEPRAAHQARPEEPRAPRAESPRPEQRGPGAHADQSHREGPPHKDR